jgi:aminoglycoside phosphotransferase (APT) family kinase protein
MPTVTDAQMAAIVERSGLHVDGPIHRMNSAGVVHSLWSLTGRWVLRVPKNEPMSVGDHRCEAIAIPIAQRTGVRTPSLMVFDDSLSILDVPYSIVGQVDGRDLRGDPPDHQAYAALGRELALLHDTDLTAHDHPWLRAPDDAPAETHFDHVVAAGLLHADGVRWLQVLCERLDVAIESGPPASRAFIHGDVKPDNAMVDREGHVHLIDWGDAAFGDPAHDFESLPMVSVARVLDGYRSVRVEDPTLEARIVRRVIARCLYNLARSPLTGPSWYRPIAANLTDMMSFALDHPATWSQWFSRP